ncbi:MAG: sigma factor-like helix-turn-helix DNA-binding protein, partial [Victivallaceae bacterium]
ELAIMELPEIYRDTVQIGILSGMDSGKAAEILGCSVNAMYQRIHKAKELLRNSMQRWINE